MHPTDGELRAYLDGEAGAASADETRRHLEACEECWARGLSLERAREAAEAALAGLDAPVDVAAARRAVRARLDAGAEAEADTGAGPRWRPSLARAALLVLLLAGGAAAAIPGSPVRGWIESAWTRITDRDGAPGVPGDTSGTPASAAARETGVRVEASDGAVRVRIRNVAPGTRIRIRLVEGEGAGVYAPPGTRFVTGPGSLEARRPAGDGAPDGEVRVEVGRRTVRALVTVNGRPFFRVEGGTVELPGPASDTLDSEVLFRVPPVSGPPPPGPGI